MFGLAVATEFDHVEAFWTAAFAGLALLANTAPLPPTSVHACTIRVVKQGSRGLTIQKGGKQGGGGTYCRGTGIRFSIDISPEDPLSVWSS